MRPWLVLLLLFAPMAQGLTLNLMPDPIILEDPVGDVDGDPIPVGAPEYVDITRVELELLEDSLRFNVKVAGVNAMINAESLQETAVAWLEFSARDAEFLVAIIIQPDPIELEGEAIQATPRLYRLESDGWVEKTRLESFDDRPGGVFETRVPYDAVRGTDDFPLGPGDTITPTHIQSRWSNVQVFFNPNTDPADANVPAQIYEDLVDIPADALLPLDVDRLSPFVATTPLPVQFSNGGGSFHWPVEVRSNIAEDRVVEVTVDAPDGVQITAPEYFSLDASEVKTIDVYASLPFAHKHGGRFDLTVNLDSKELHAELPVAIHFLDVPQPAGHHSRLYMHAEPGGSVMSQTDPEAGTVRNAWLSTLEKEDGSTAAYVTPSPGLCEAQGEQQNGLHWSIPLEPALLIGLDADPDQPIQIQGRLKYDAPVEADLYTRFVQLDDREYELTSPDEWTRVTHHTLGDTEDLSGDIPTPPEFDRIDPTSDMKNIGISFALCPTDGTPMHFDFGRLYTDLVIDLPLIEYQATLDFTNKGSSITLDTPEPLVRVAPGATVLWTIDAVGTDGAYDLSIIGPNADLFQIIGPTRMHGTTQVHVSAVVPEDAEDGLLLQGILHVASADSPEDSTAQILAIEVDPTSGRDDAAAVTELVEMQGKNTPFGSVALIVACITLAVLQARRRGL